MSAHVSPAGQRSGILISEPLDGGPVVQSDTVSCIHCAYTWVWTPGSGKRRGFCQRCNGIVCGRPWCVANGCVHREQQLANMETGRPDSYRPIIVRVEGTPPR